MAHLGSRRRRALALPAGLALTVSLGFLPTGTATAATAAGSVPAAAVATDGPKLSYVVNTRGGHSTVTSVKKAIAEAGGTVVTSYDQIGVIVVTSQNPEFARTVRKVKGVDSAGSTRTAPMSAQSTTVQGAPQVRYAQELAAPPPKAKEKK
ncbi:peptidase S8, partial [Streptomyces scopuliridis]